MSRIVAALFFASALLSQDPAHRILEGLRDSQGIPGLAVAVGVDDRIVFSEGFGWSDIENRVPVRRETRFRIGSVAKPLTAAAMALLIQRGSLDPDRSIRDYVPSFPDKGHVITARQLAGHLGGIRHYPSDGFFNLDQFDSVEESLTIFSGDPLVREPGTGYSYSTFGYVLLSAVMESAAGQSYLDFMEANIFDPIRMSHTVPETAAELIPDRAEFYDRREGELLNARTENYSYKWAGGGFLSTADDLVRFGLALLAGDIVDTSMLPQLFQSQKTSTGEETGYGMGWRPETDGRERPVVHHGGSSEGARAFLLLYPEQHVAIALLANLSTANLFQGEAECLAQLFIPGDEMPEPAPDGLEGLYRFSATIDGNEVTGHLSLNRDGDTYEGWVSRFYSANASIVHAALEGDGIRLVLATRSGLPSLWLRFTTDGFEGSWGWERPRWPIRGTRVED